MSETFTLGAYTVQIGIRADNPAFPIYRIFRGKAFIGKQFSRPCETDCQWLEREETTYANGSKLLQHTCLQQRIRAGFVTAATTKAKRHFTAAFIDAEDTPEPA